MLALVGFTALAVDVGNVMTTRNELQNIADGAALAAAVLFSLPSAGYSEPVGFYDRRVGSRRRHLSVRPVEDASLCLVVDGNNGVAANNARVP